MSLYQKFLDWVDAQDVTLTTQQMEAARALLEGHLFSGGRANGKTFLLDLLKQFHEETP